VKKLSNRPLGTIAAATQVLAGPYLDGSFIERCLRGL
jgi:hypothetical protein